MLQITSFFFKRVRFDHTLRKEKINNPATANMNGGFAAMIQDFHLLTSGFFQDFRKSREFLKVSSLVDSPCQGGNVRREQLRGNPNWFEGVAKHIFQDTRHGIAVIC